MEKCKACVQKDATWKNAKLVWKRRSVVNGAEPILENPSIDICFWEHSDLWGVIASRLKVLRDQWYCADPILVRWTKIRTACQPQSSCRAADGTSLSNAQNTYASNKDCVSAAPQLMAFPLDC